MATLLAGKAPDATPVERALIDLVRRAHEAPALLSPADLEPVRAVAGDGALDYLLVLCAFHWITRIAAKHDALPIGKERSLTAIQ